MALAKRCVADNWNAAHGKHQGTYWGAFEGWAYYQADHDPTANLSTALGGIEANVIGGKANMCTPLSHLLDCSRGPAF